MLEILGKEIVQEAIGGKPFFLYYVKGDVPKAIEVLNTTCSACKYVNSCQWTRGEDDKSCGKLELK